jgi:hypothetical protein
VTLTGWVMSKGILRASEMPVFQASCQDTSHIEVDWTYDIGMKDDLRN